MAGGWQEGHVTSFPYWGLSYPIRGLFSTGHCDCPMMWPPFAPADSLVVRDNVTPSNRRSAVRHFGSICAKILRCIRRVVRSSRLPSSARTGPNATQLAPICPVSVDRVFGRCAVSLKQRHITMAAHPGNENRTDAEIAKARTCLDRILSSSCFVQSERQQRFLKFVVTETLAGHTDRLKGYTIALEVFDRDVSFDPGIDAIVRVEAARLRAKLREYYEREGRTDPVRFELPKGAYLIHMEWRAPETMPSRQQSHEARAQTIGQAISRRLQPIEDRPSLAVLPFANLSSDSEQAYFADGITDGLMAELSRVRGLFLPSRHSSFV